MHSSYQNERGIVRIIPLLIIITVIGLISFLLISSTAPFNNGLFGFLFPKPASEASTSNDLDILNDQFLKSARQYKLSPTSQNLATLTQIATKRGQIMSQAMKSDSNSFFRHSLTNSLRSSLPSSIQNLVEYPLQLDGKAEVLVSASTNGQSTRQIKVNGFNINFGQQTPPIQDGQIVSLAGVVINPTLDVMLTQKQLKRLQSGLTNSFKPKPQDTTGSKKVAVILLNFKGDPSTNDYQSKPMTRADISNTFFDPSSRSVAAYYREATYNKLLLSGTVFDWVTLDDPVAPCDYQKWSVDAENILKLQGNDLSQYDFKVHIFPHQNSCKDTPVDVAVASFFGTDSYYNGFHDPIYFVHEIAHNLGFFEHAGFLSCGSVAISDNCQLVDGQDIMDPLNSSNSPGSPDNGIPPHFNAPHKIAGKWLSDSGVQTINLKKSGTYTISPLELNSGGIQTLKIKTDRKPNTLFDLFFGNKEWYYLEYRQPIGFDNSARVTPQGTGGVMLHLWDNDAASATELIKFPQYSVNGVLPYTLADNQSFNDPTSNLTITQLSHNSLGAKVLVEHGNPICVQQPPLITVNTLPPTVVSGTAVTYAVSLTNTDSPACPSTTFNLSSRLLNPGWTTSTLPTSLTLASGETQDFTTTITSPKTATDGDYLFTIVAADNILPTHQTQQPYNYNIINPTPCTLANPGWSSTSTVKGTAVTLSVSASGTCGGQLVHFAIKQNGLGGGNTALQPPDAPIAVTVATAKWVAEYTPVIPGTDPDYIFTANIVGQNNFITSGLLHVTNPVTPTPTPTPSPSSNPLPANQIDSSVYLYNIFETVIGQDQLPRLLYSAHSSTNATMTLRYVKCLDIMCLNRSSTDIITAPLANAPVNTSIDLGKDGFPRLFYIKQSPTHPSFSFIYVQCLDDECNGRVSTEITELRGDNPIFMGVSIGPDGFARMGAADKFVVRCLNDACTSRNVTTLNPPNGQVLMNLLGRMRIGTDGFTNGMFVQNNTTDPNFPPGLLYGHCRDLDCNSISTNYWLKNNNLGYGDFILDNNNIASGAEIFSTDPFNLPWTESFVRCLDQTCTNVTSFEIETASVAQVLVIGPNVVKDNNGLIRVIYGIQNSSGRKLKMLVCEDQTCTNHHLQDLLTLPPSPVAGLGQVAVNTVISSNGKIYIFYSIPDTNSTNHSNPPSNLFYLVIPNP